MLQCELSDADGADHCWLLVSELAQPQTPLHERCATGDWSPLSFTPDPHDDASCASPRRALNKRQQLRAERNGAGYTT